MAEKINYGYGRKNKEPSRIPADEFGKLPPQAPELEEAILGACFTDANCCSIALRILTNECFYKVAHQKIFEAIEQMAEKEIPIETITVTQHMRTLGTIDDIGGPYAIMLIRNKLASIVNCEYHCRCIWRK